MTEASRTRRIAADRAAVWAMLADFDHIGDWAPPVDHSSWFTAGPAGVGAQRRVQVGSQVLIETVEVWDEPSALAYRVHGLPPFVGTVTNRWELVPATAAAGETRAAGGTHQTDVTLTVSIEPGDRRGAALVAPVVVRRFARENARMLDGLAAAAAVATG